MLKHSVQTILSIFLSVAFSLAASFAYIRHSLPPRSNIVRTAAIELVDEKGNVRGEFRLVKPPGGTPVPQLIMRDQAGRESIVMQVDARGDGDLSFASDHWNEGAVILGHLGTVDDGTQATSNDKEDRTGAWGLQVRGQGLATTGVEFLNSGRLIIPSTTLVKP